VGRLLRGCGRAAVFILVLRTVGRWAFGRIEASDSHLFDPGELQEIANIGAGLPLGERWSAIHQELLRRYPGKIAPEVRWTFNSAGNVVCQIAIVYASVTEYVAFFGTPIGATGFSGRYRHADVWDLMVDGRMITCTPGQMEPTEYGPGDSAYLPKGTVKMMTYIGSTWMIDYGRGLPLTMMPFGITGPAAFSTLDFRSAGEQLYDYGRLVLRGMFGSVDEGIDGGARAGGQA
jgi:hypothetical protein